MKLKKMEQMDEMVRTWSIEFPWPADEEPPDWAVAWLMEDPEWDTDEDDETDEPEVPERASVTGADPEEKWARAYRG